MKSEALLEAREELYTIRDFLRFGVSCFTKAELYYGHGTDEPWDDMAALLLYTLSLPADIDNRVLDARLTSSEKTTLLNLITQRIEKRIPVPYLTKQAYFAGLNFYVDERVLIPRSPIAELIEKQFSPWIEASQVKHILDIGTGSGCIAIACALYFPDAKVVGSDISLDAIAVAEKNLRLHDCEHQVTLMHSDVFESLMPKKFDIIVSNPPYVSSAEMQTLPKEYLHEPNLALQAADEGLAIVLNILRQAKNFLTDQGILVVEVGNSFSALVSRFPTVPFVWLEFERGGQGVFLLTVQDLNKYQAQFMSE